MESGTTPFVRTRLSIAYFLEFAIWGGWAIALGGFATQVLGFSGAQVGWLYSAIPLGAIISPLFIGPIADRYFPAQFVVAVLHVLSGLCLIACGFTESFGLLMTLMILHGVFFMPTIALVNSVVFKHLPNPDYAPRVFVFGTLGWIAVNIFVEIVCGGMASSWFFVVAGVISLVLAAYCLTLPNTPPKGSEGGDVLGLGALKLLADGPFAIFVVCAFLASIPACGLYFAVVGSMLGQRGYPSPLALGTLNQVSEILFMVLLPVFVTRIGLKWVLVLGMLAWVARYFLFMNPAFAFALLGLLLHGLCYAFLYVGAYMYGNKKAPEQYKASVQSLLAFLLLGVGQFAGAQLAGAMMDRYPPAITKMAVASQTAGVSLPLWEDPTTQDSAWRYLDIAGTVKGLFFGTEGATEKRHLGTDVDKNRDNVITLEELRVISEDGLVYGEVKYSVEDLERVFRDIAAEREGVSADELAEEKVRLTREEWLTAQAHRWHSIFFAPAIGILIVAVVFMFLGKTEEEPDSLA